MSRSKSYSCPPARHKDCAPLCPFVLARRSPLEANIRPLTLAAPIIFPAEPKWPKERVSYVISCLVDAKQLNMPVVPSLWLSAMRRPVLTCNRHLPGQSRVSLGCLGTILDNSSIRRRDRSDMTEPCR